MIERYPPSKYANAFGADMFISPPSNSGSTISDPHEPPDYKVFIDLDSSQNSTFVF